MLKSLFAPGHQFCLQPTGQSPAPEAMVNLKQGMKITGSKFLFYIMTDWKLILHLRMISTVMSMAITPSGGDFPLDIGMESIHNEIPKTRAGNCTTPRLIPAGPYMLY